MMAPVSSPTQVAFGHHKVSSISSQGSTSSAVAPYNSGAVSNAIEKASGNTYTLVSFTRRANKPFFDI